MKYVEEYLETVVKVKPLGELTTREDILNDMSGEMVYIDSKCSDIFISHADYANWLEKQRQNPAEWHREDEQNLNACLGYIPDEYLRRWLMDVVHVKYDNPADKIEQKFKVGDWIVTDKNHIWLIDKDCSTTGYSYRLISQNGKVEVGDYNIVDEHAHLWTIQDAKPGDVLVTDFEEDNMIVMYHSMCTIDTINVCCCLDNKFVCGNLGVFDAEDVKPATKEQRDLLFQKMKEKGYEWDAEKKELKKIHVIDEGKAEMDYCFTKMMNGEKVSPAWNEKDEKTWKELIEEVKDQLDSVPAPDCRDKEDEKALKQLTRWLVWLKSIKERWTWKPSEELDEASYHVGIKRVLDNPESYGLTKYNWKPSDEQMEYLAKAILTLGNEGDCKTASILNELRTDLKKLKEE